MVPSLRTTYFCYFGTNHFFGVVFLSGTSFSSVLAFPCRKWESHLELLWLRLLMQCWTWFLVLVMQVFLAKRKHDGKYYAVKVLQKKVILNRKEVNLLTNMTSTLSILHTCKSEIYFFYLSLPPISKSTSWQSATCCWRMWNTLSWLGFIIPFRLKTNYTLSWISSMEEKWVVSVLWIIHSHRTESQGQQKLRIALTQEMCVKQL